MAFIIIIIPFLLLAIYGYSLLNRRKEEKAPEEDNAKATQFNVPQHIEKLLTQLNCKYQLEKQELWHEYSFRFQNGNFIITCHSQHAEARIDYPNFYLTSIDRLGIVRQVCNECNLQNYDHHAAYSVNGKDNYVAVHIVSSITLLGEDALYEEQLAKVLEMSFGVAQDFKENFSKQVTKADENGYSDIEKDNAHNQRFLEIAMECESHHNCFNWQPVLCNDNNPLTLAGLFRHLYHLNQPEFLLLKVVTHELTEIVTEEDIANFDLCSALIHCESTTGEPNFIGRNATLILTFTADREKPQGMPSSMTIQLQAEKRTSQQLFLSATLCVCPDKMAYLQEHTASRNDQQLVHLLFAYEYRSSNAEDTEDITPNTENQNNKDNFQKYDLRNPLYAKVLKKADSLFREKRFYETAVLLEKIYPELMQNIRQVPKAQLSVLRHICFHIGVCYTHLGRYKEAFYYLSDAVAEDDMLYIQAYINCLVNAKDHRALPYINRLLRNFEKAKEYDHEEDFRKSMIPFYKFLLRRKAYALLDQNEVEMAKTIYQEMLDDPESQDYALNELAYIQKHYEFNHSEENEQKTSPEASSSTNEEKEQ